MSVLLGCKILLINPIEWIIGILQRTAHLFEVTHEALREAERRFPYLAEL